MSKPDTASSPPPPPVSLADVKSAGIQIEWDEAVAIGQALCQVFLVAQVTRRIVAAADDFGDRPAFGLEDVFIDSTGRVSIGQNCPRTVPAAIECVGKVLSRILPSKDPLALKARIVSKATSVPPAFGSMEELSRTLEGYERRNWTELIRGLYDRVQKGESREPAPMPAAPTESAIAPVEMPFQTSAVRSTPVAPAPKREARRRNVPPYVLYGVGAVAVVLLVAGAWPYVARRGAPAPAPAASAPPAENAPDAAAAPPASTGSSKPGEKASAANTPAGKDAGRAAAGSRSRTTTRNVPGLPTADAAPAAGSTASSEVKDTARESAGGAARASNSGTTFSAADPDVIPPTVVYPTLLEVLSPASPGVRKEMLTIAVIVNERGTVDSVKAVNSPRSIGESVVLASALSTVKAWRFRPAMRDGAPVKYRQVIPVDVVPGIGKPSLGEGQSAPPGPATELDGSGR